MVVSHVTHTQTSSHITTSHQVDVPNLVTCLNQTSINLNGTYMVRCGFKGGYPKYMCLKEIGPHAQKKITILGSIVNIVREGKGGGLYDHLMTMKIFTLLRIVIYI